MNHEQSSAHERYNAHIKESLMSGKSIEMNMKDFLPQKRNNKKVYKKGDGVKQVILNIIKRNKEEYFKMPEYPILRHSLLSNEVMNMMNEAETLEEVKEIYATYKSIIYNTPI